MKKFFRYKHILFLALPFIAKAATNLSEWDWWNNL